MTVLLQGALIVNARLVHGAIPANSQRIGLVATDQCQLCRALWTARAKRADGSYEPPQPHHSWNANHVYTNLLLFQLERHSDHHANGTRRYQSLRHFEDLPQLSGGYNGMYPLAYVPWLWFKVMDPRLLALKHIAGDLARINIDPERRVQIHQRYGVRTSAVVDSPLLRIFSGSAAESRPLLGGAAVQH